MNSQGCDIIKKQRDSNIELLRVISILLVLILHADFYALQGPSVAEIRINTIDAVIRILFQIISIPAVNIFVMISGWYGIRQSKKGVLNLSFQISFWLIGILLIISTITKKQITYTSILELFLATSSNWFIKAYILLYILSPILNIFAERAGKKSFKNILIAFFVFQTFYGWLFPKSTDYFNGGYSPLSFIGIYLLARFLKIYKPNITRLDKRHYVLYLCCIILTICIVCILPSIIFSSDTVYGYIFLNYVSPTTIVMSALILLLFSKFQIKSKFVNRLGVSSFAVYLVYVNPNILCSYGKFFSDVYKSVNGYQYWILVLILITVLYAIVAIFDEVRIIIWNRIYKKYIDERF